MIAENRKQKRTLRRYKSCVRDKLYVCQSLRCPSAKESASFSSQFNPNFQAGQILHGSNESLAVRIFQSFTCIGRKNLRARSCPFQLSQMFLERRKKRKNSYVYSRPRDSP